jgi:hypothetical protein
MMETTRNQSRPQNDTQIHFTAFQPKPLRINSERQYRLVMAILKHPKATNTLIQIVGANNVPDAVKRLRSKGWQIATLEQDVKTRDGLRVTAGLYRLDTPIEIAKESLRAWRIKHPLNEL